MSLLTKSRIKWIALLVPSAIVFFIFAYREVRQTSTLKYFEEKLAASPTKGRALVKDLMPLKNDTIIAVCFNSADDLRDYWPSRFRELDLTSAVARGKVGEYWLSVTVIGKRKTRYSEFWFQWIGDEEGYNIADQRKYCLDPANATFTTTDEIGRGSGSSTYLGHGTFSGTRMNVKSE